MARRLWNRRLAHSCLGHVNPQRLQQRCLLFPSEETRNGCSRQRAPALGRSARGILSALDELGLRAEPTPHDPINLGSRNWQPDWAGTIGGVPFIVEAKSRLKTVAAVRRPHGNSPGKVGSDIHDLVRLTRDGDIAEIAAELALEPELANWVAAQVDRLFDRDLRYTLIRLRRFDNSVAAQALADDEIGATAIARLFSVVIPCMWVGPPTINRPTPSSSSGVASCTGTTETSWVAAKPVAMWSAKTWVFPNTDSYTTTARISTCSSAGRRSPATAPDPARLSIVLPGPNILPNRAGDVRQGSFASVRRQRGRSWRAGRIRLVAALSEKVDLSLPGVIERGLAPTRSHVSAIAWAIARAKRNAPEE